MKTILFLFISITSFSLCAQNWIIEEMEAMPEAISNNAVCEGFVNGVPYVYTFAGIDDSKEHDGIHNRAYRYNTMSNEWEMIPALPDFMGKIAASANRIGDIIYIIGGYHVFSNGTEVSSNKVHRYNTATNTYLTDGASIPVAIDDQVQVVYNDSLIYVVSGWSNSQNVNDVQIYDPVNNEWHVGTPITWQEEPVFGAAGTILNDTIYFFGGAKNGDFSASVRLRKGAINPDNPTEIEWSSDVLSFGIKGYRPAATTVYEDEVVFIGGSDETYNYDGLAYSDGEGVEPNNRILTYYPNLGTHAENLQFELPMDLRGIASYIDSVESGPEILTFDTKFIAGGMMSNQNVSDKLWKLVRAEETTSTQSLNSTIPAIKTFPNPAVNLIQFDLLRFSNCEEVTLKVIDLQGKTLIKSIIKDCEKSLDISSLPQGQYIIEFLNGKAKATGKFTKI